MVRASQRQGKETECEMTPEASGVLFTASGLS